MTSQDKKIVPHVIVTENEVDRVASPALKRALQQAMDLAQRSEVRENFSDFDSFSDFSKGTF